MRELVLSTITYLWALALWPVIPALSASLASRAKNQRLHNRLDRFYTLLYVGVLVLSLLFLAAPWGAVPPWGA